MLNLKNTKTLSAVALAVAVIGAPTLAHAGTYSSSAYENCKRSDTEGQILGGVLGAVAGGVFGSQVAGNGARTEGSVLGAVLGGAAGSQIANKDCRTRTVYSNESYHPPAQVYGTSGGYSSGGYTTSAPVYSTTTVTRAPVYSSGGYTSHAPVYDTGRTVYTSPRVVNAHHPVSQPIYAQNHKGYKRGKGHYKNKGYGGYDQVASINRELEELRYKRDELQRRNRYERSYRLDRRIERIGERIRELKRERKYAKNDRGYNTGYNVPRSGGHYHGSNICYTTH